MLCGPSMFYVICHLSARSSIKSAECPDHSDCTIVFSDDVRYPGSDALFCRHVLSYRLADRAHDGFRLRFLEPGPFSSLVALWVSNARALMSALCVMNKGYASAMESPNPQGATRPSRPDGPCTSDEVTAPVLPENGSACRMHQEPGWSCAPDERKLLSCWAQSVTLPPSSALVEVPRDGAKLSMPIKKWIIPEVTPAATCSSSDHGR